MQMNKHERDVFGTVRTIIMAPKKNGRGGELVGSKQHSTLGASFTCHLLGNATTFVPGYRLHRQKERDNSGKKKSSSPTHCYCSPAL